MDEDQMDISKMRADAIDHLENHVKYPATKEDLVEACNKMSDVSDKNKEWFINNLPDGTYDNAEEVKEALGIIKAKSSSDEEMGMQESL